jgi:hypothetical protein
MSPLKRSGGDTSELRTPQSRGAGYLIGITAALLLAACGGTSSAGSASGGGATPAAPAPSAGHADFCSSVFTQQDAQALLGGPVDQPTPGQAEACQYNMTGPPFATAKAEVVRYSSPAAAHAAYTSARHGPLYGDGQDVTGLGDAAVDAGPAGLLVLHGSLLLDLNTTQLDSSAALRQLAGTLVQRAS